MSRHTIQTIAERMAEPLYWWQFTKDNGSVTVKSNKVTLAKFWELYRDTYLPKPTAEGMVLDRTVEYVVEVRLLSATTSTVVWPLPEAIGKTAVGKLKAEQQVKAELEAQAEAEGKVVCSDCGNMADEDDSHTLSDGRVVCESCHEGYATCERCDSTVSNDDCREVTTATRYGRSNITEVWCESCVDDHTFRCSDCSDTYSDSCENYDVNGNTICRSCMENGDYTTCGDCGDLIYCDDSYYSERDEESYCSDCYRRNGRDRSDSDYVHEYGYSPKPIFHGGAGKMHYGVELEVSADTDNAEETIDRLGGDSHVYLKEDCSIEDGGGFEIVSHPHTMEAHRKVWDAEFFDWARHCGMKANHNGMHVHIQRKYLTVFQIQKMQSFLNAPENLQFVQEVAGRDTGRWAACKAELAKITAKGGCARYQALNLLNEKTVEVRIFRGTVKFETFWKNMEFVEALVRFTVDRSYRDLTVQSFVKFVRSERKAWKHLDAFLADKGYLPVIASDKRKAVAA